MLTLDKQNALNVPVARWVWILQTLPAIVFGLSTRLRGRDRHRGADLRLPGAEVGNGTDISATGDYFAEVGDPGVETTVTEQRPIPCI